MCEAVTHRHAFDVEIELREVGHRRERKADIVNLAAAGEKSGDERLLHAARVPAVIVSDDEALRDPALRKQRRHAKADRVEPHQVDLLRKEPARIVLANPVGLTSGRRSKSAVFGLRSARGRGA